MAINFQEALNKPLNEIERPPLVPIGTYKAIVTKIPALETSADQKWDFLMFPIRLQEAQEDVSQEDLAEFGGLGPHAVMTRRFIFNKEDQAAFDRELFNLKRFITEHLKVEWDEGKTSLKEALDQTMNREFMVFIKHQPDKNDKEVLYAQIAKTAPVA